MHSRDFSSNLAESDSKVVGYGHGSLLDETSRAERERKRISKIAIDTARNLSIIRIHETTTTTAIVCRVKRENVIGNVSICKIKKKRYDESEFFQSDSGCYIID